MKEKIKKFLKLEEIRTEKTISIIYELKKTHKYFYIALLGLLIGIIIKGTIGKVFDVISIICGIIWLLKIIQLKMKAKQLDKN